MDFGSYLRQLREQRSLRQTDIAEILGVSAVYICDIEKGRRNPLDHNKIAILARRMEMSEDEVSQLFDLAGVARGSVAPDISDYLEKNPSAKDAIRRIVSRGISFDWNRIP